MALAGPESPLSNGNGHQHDSAASEDSFDSLSSLSEPTKATEC